MLNFTAVIAMVDQRYAHDFFLLGCKVPLVQ